MQDSLDFFKVQILYQTVIDTSSDNNKFKIQLNTEASEQIFAHSPPFLANLGLIGDYDLCLKAAGRFLDLSQEQDKQCREFDYEEGILIIRKNEKLIFIYKASHNAFLHSKKLTNGDSLAVTYTKYILDLCPKILIITPKNFILNEGSLSPWEEPPNSDVFLQCNQIDPIISMKVKALPALNQDSESQDNAEDFILCADGTNFIIGEKKADEKFLHIVKPEIDSNKESKSLIFISFKRSLSLNTINFDVEQERIFKEWTEKPNVIKNLQTSIEDEFGRFIAMDYYLEFRGIIAQHVESYNKVINSLEEEHQEKNKSPKKQSEAQKALVEKKKEALKLCLKDIFKWMDVRKNYKIITFTFSIVSCEIVKTEEKPINYTFKNHRPLEFSLGCTETNEINITTFHFTANSTEACSGFFMAADKGENTTSLYCFEFNDKENMPTIVKEEEFPSIDTKMIVDNSLEQIFIYDNTTKKASMASIRQKKKLDKFVDINLYGEVPLDSQKPLKEILGGCFLRDKNSLLLFDQNFGLLEYDYMNRTLQVALQQTEDNGNLKRTPVKPKNPKHSYTEAQSFSNGKYVMLKCNSTLDVYDMNWKLMYSLIISRYFATFKLFSQGNDTYLLMIQDVDQVNLYLLSESLICLSCHVIVEPCEVPKGNPILDVFYLAHKQFGSHSHFIGAPPRTEIILLNESSNFPSQLALDYFEDLGCNRMNLKVKKGIAVNAINLESLELFSEDTLVRLMSMSCIITSRIPAQCARIEDSFIVPLILEKDKSGRISDLIRSRSKDLITLANIINTIKLGIYDKLLSSLGTAFKVISIVGKKDASQNHLINRLFGSRFNTNNNIEEYNDEIWITMCRIKEQSFVVIDFRSLLNFEITEQEQFKLNLILAAISDIFILNQDLAFNNKLKAFFKYFKEMIEKINRADLFKGSLNIFINGVDNPEHQNTFQYIVDNFKIKLQKTKNEYLLKLFPGKIRFQALHPPTAASYDKELDKTRLNLLNIPYRWFNGKEFLDTFKMLLGQSSIDDYSDMNIAKPRLEYLRWIEESCPDDDFGGACDIDVKLVYQFHERDNNGKVSYRYPLMLESPQDLSLYSIAMKINEIEGHAFENKDDKRFKEVFKNFTEIFNKIYTENTELRKYDKQGNCVLDLFSKLGENQQTQKECYLADIRNHFLQKIMNAASGLSNFFERFISQFVRPTFKVTEYIMLLLIGESLWKFAIQFYQALYSLTGNSILVENLLFPQFNKQNSEQNLRDFFQNQLSYIKAFLESCEYNLAPTRENITSVGGYKNYSIILNNLSIWFIHIRNEYEKFGISIPSILELTREFLNILELICYQNAPEVFNEIIKNVVVGPNGYAMICPLIDNFLEDSKKELNKDDRYKITSFQAGLLFKYWVLNYTRDQQTDLIRRLLERIYNDHDFPNFCIPIIKAIMPQKNFSTINEIFAALEESEGLLSLLVSHSKDIKQPRDSNNFFILLTDYFDRVLVDPKIEFEDEREATLSAQLATDFQNFVRYVEILENQKYNDIQLLAIMAFIRHYLSCYVECFLANHNSQTMRDIDAILNKGSPLKTSLCIYCMKKLRSKQKSFKNLGKILYDVTTADWPQRFEDQFGSDGKTGYYVPLLSNNDTEIRIVEKWRKLKDLAFKNKEIFKEIISEAAISYNGQYQVLNLFLQDAYTGAIGPTDLNTLRGLVASERSLIANSFNRYQYTLLNCYIDQFVNKHFLNVRPGLTHHDIHLQMAILNAINWLVSLNRFNSPWTSLFFKDGDIPRTFSTHYSNQNGGIDHVSGEFDLNRTYGSFLSPRAANGYQYHDSFSTDDTIEICRRFTTRNNSYVSNDGNLPINSLKKITNDVLQFLFHTSLYVFSSLNWITTEHALRVINNAEIHTELPDYLKDRIVCNIMDLKNRLENREDPISWVIGLQQMLPQIIAEKDRISNYQNISLNSIQDFEMEVQRLISENRTKMTSYLYTLDSVICEQILTSEYHYLSLLRVTKSPCFDDMLLHDNLIKSKYPLIEKCREKIQDLEEIAKLSSILDFSNDVMKFADYQLTLEDAKSLKIVDFISTLSKEEQYNLKPKLKEFLQAWNSLDFPNILYKSKPLGPIPQYNENSPVISFIADSCHKSGQVLAAAISILSERQNKFLEEIVNIIRNLNEIKEDLFGNHLYLPQSVNPEGILNLTKDVKFNEVLKLAFSCDCKYGNGEVLIFDFEVIQSKLLREIMKKKQLITDPTLYPNIHFLGDFSKQDIFEHYISKLRQLNPKNLLPDTPKVKEVFEEFQKGRAFDFFGLKLKQFQGSLEKIMLLYGISPHNDIALNQYLKALNLEAMSSLLTEESFIKDYDIKYIVALYELTEEMMVQTLWNKVLPKVYKLSSISPAETKTVAGWLQNIKNRSANSNSIRLLDLTTAISRFASRSLVFSDFSDNTALKSCLFKRKDFWPFDIKEEQIQSLSGQFPHITLAQIESFKKLILDVEQSRIVQQNPQKPSLQHGSQQNSAAIVRSRDGNFVVF